MIECEVTSAALLLAEPYEAVRPHATSEFEDWSVVHVMVAYVVPVLEAMLLIAGGVEVAGVAKVWSLDVEVNPLASVETTAK